MFYDYIKYNVLYMLYILCYCSMLGDIVVGFGIQKFVFVQKMVDLLVDEDVCVEWKYICICMYIFYQKFRVLDFVVFILFFIIQIGILIFIKFIIYVFIMKVLNNCVVLISKIV